LTGNLSTFRKKATLAALFWEGLQELSTFPKKGFKKGFKKALKKERHLFCG